MEPRLNEELAFDEKLRSRAEPDTLHSIIVICAVCKKFMDIKDGQGISGNSHSLCPDCLPSVLPRPRNPYLEPPK